MTPALMLLKPGESGDLHPIPVAVNPDRVLRRIAAERGWPVLRFRDAA